MKMEQRKINWRVILISSLCMIVALYIIYFIKGVFPFGSNNIAYYDMAQSYVPIYYHIYDALHGTKSFLFDWYSGAGGSMVDHLGAFTLNPLNLLMYLVPRNQVLNLMSIFLVIKVAVAAGAMSFYSSWKYKDISSFWHVVAGVLYASSGYFVQYYTNIHYLDIVVVFPLLIWAYERMILDKKVGAYIAIMSYCCLVNIYFSGLFCPFLILYGFVLVRGIQDKRERKKAAWRIALYTVGAILISGIITIPTLDVLNNSVRSYIASKNTYFDALAMTFTAYDGQKQFMLYGSELPIAIAIIYCVQKGKQGIKKNAGKLFLLIALMIPIWVESVNYLLHIVDYVMFPMRFGYILTFTALIIMGDIIQSCHNEEASETKEITVEKAEDEKKEENGEDNSKGSDMSFVGLFAIAMIPFSVIILYSFAKHFIDYGIVDVQYYHAYWLCFVCVAITYGLAWLSKRKDLIKVVTICMVVCQVLIGWYGFMAPKYDYYPETGEEMIWLSEEIKTAEAFETKELDRIKDKTVLLSSNYPFVMETASISNWTWGTNNQLLFNMMRLGYSNSYTRIMDVGGTLYSDMLLNIKEVVTLEEPNSDLYTVYGKTDNFYLSKMNYEYPFGFMVDDGFFTWDTTSTASGMEYQNEMFKAMTGNEKDLITIYPEADFVMGEGYDNNNPVYYKDYIIQADGRVILYLEPTQFYNNYVTIRVNGEWLKIPTLKDTQNMVYPGYFNNGIIDCGMFENETIDLHIEFQYENTGEDFNIGLFDMEVLEESVAALAAEQSTYEATKTGLVMEKNASRDGYVFLPVGYNPNWKVTVNGEKAEAKSGIGGSFIFVPVSAGDNRIELKFQPSGFGKGLLMTLAGVLICALGIFMDKKDTKIDFMAKVAEIGLYGLFFGIMIFVYIIPIVMYLVNSLARMFVAG